MVIVVPVSRATKVRPVRAFLWRIAHKFSIFAPPTVGTGYGIVLGLAAQADRGTDARALFDNQIVMWRAIVLAPYGWIWLFGFLLLWLLVVLWTAHKTEEREKENRSTPPAIQERKQAKAPRTSTRATDALIEQYDRASRWAEADARVANAAKIAGPIKDRDTDIKKALGFAITGDWDTIIGIGVAISGKMQSLDRAIERFRNAAARDELRVWGRSEPDGLYVRIDPSFWASNTLDRTELFSVWGRGRSEPMGEDEADDPFHGIMVNRFEVEKVWPHEY